MPTVDLGSLASVEWRHATSNSVTVTVTQPDGTTATPPVTTAGNDHSAKFEAAQPGRHLLTWTDTETVYVDIVDVWPSDPRFLISAADAAAALRWRPADIDARADDLRLYNAAATEVIEDIVGAVLVRTVVQHADGGRTGVALWERPDEIIEVSVDDVVRTDWVANMSAGIIYAGKDRSASFPDGWQNVEITYNVGAAAIPSAIRTAVRILLRHMVSVDQSPAAADGGASGGVDMGRTPSGFMVPNRVIELCQHRRTLPGIA